MNKDQNLTREDIKAMIAETSRQIKETGKQFAETDKKLLKMFAEADKQIKESRERSDELRHRLEEIANSNKEQLKETGKQLSELGRYLGGMANSNGEMAEDFFYHTIKRDKTFVNEKFDKIIANSRYLRDEDSMEWDIYLFNGTSTAIIEVKYNAKYENVSADKLISRVARFREHYPDYKNHNVYLGVAALAFNKGLKRKLHQKGIATIHQIGKKMVVYDKEVKVF